MKEKTEIQKVIEAIEFFEKKIKAQGMITNARDEDHLIKLREYLKALKTN